MNLATHQLLEFIKNSAINNLLSELHECTQWFEWQRNGGHSIFNQLENEQTKYIIMSMFCPLELKNDKGSTVWVQPLPNSPNSQRPVYLQMGKESSEALESLKIFNKDRV